MSKAVNKNLTTELECTVCLEVPKVETRVYQCNNGHIFCQTCYIKLSMCPTCRQTLFNSSDIENNHGPIRCLLAENLIRQLTKIPNCDIDHAIKDSTKTSIILDSSKHPEEEMIGKEEITLEKIMSSNKQRDFGVYWGRRLPIIKNY